MQEMKLQSTMAQENALNEAHLRITNNIETLDYLRGISCLERDFVHLADKVVKTSLQLSHECNNINRESLNPTEMTEEVDSSWRHISQLGNIVQTHVKHARRYHLFYLAIDNLHHHLSELSEHLEGLPTCQRPEEKRILDLAADIHQTLESLVQAYVSWQKLKLKLPMVAPLHRRMPLPGGRHSGTLMAPISLPASPQTGKMQRLEAGTRVHVRANRPADLLHREWFLEEEGDGGRLVASVPAAFVWLNSPDSSPERTNEKSQRSRSLCVPMSRINNNQAVEELQGHLFGVWEKASSKYDQILRETGIAFLHNTLSDTETPVNEEGVEALRKALQKMSELVGIVKYHHDDGTENLIDLIDTTKSRLSGQGRSRSLAIDPLAAGAMVQAIDIFEEMVGCFQRYGARRSPEVNFSVAKLSKGRKEGTSDRRPETKKTLSVSPQPVIAPTECQPVASAAPTEHSEAPREPETTSPKKVRRSTPRRRCHRRSRSASLPFDDDSHAATTKAESEVTCPYSPPLSKSRAQHSVSLLRRGKKADHPTEGPDKPRGRRRDRVYRLFPSLLRRHSRKGEKRGKSDGSEHRQSTSSLEGRQDTPSVQQKPTETLTLGRVSYTKKSDITKFRRPPLVFSTPSTLDSGNVADGESGELLFPGFEEKAFTQPDASSTCIGVAQQEKPRPVTGRASRLYSVACQSGVCVDSSMTDVDSAIGDDKAFKPVEALSKKLQVGRSFTAVKMDGQPGLASHVYANINPKMFCQVEQASPPESSSDVPTTPREEFEHVVLYDIGVQVDLPNRLKALRCRLEFEQPGVEIGDKDNLTCQTFDEAPRNVDPDAEQDYRTLSFRVAFNNKPPRCASTL